jgi:hypothetical protein
MTEQDQTPRPDDDDAMGHVRKADDTTDDDDDDTMGHVRKA